MLLSKRRRGKSMWVMHGFEFRLSLSLSLSLSQSWSSSLLVICLLLICPRSREIYLLCYFSLLIGSNWVFFVFYHKGLSEKLLLIIFIFWQISSTFRDALTLCTESPFFHFEESLSTNNIWWMLSWALVAIIILCVWKTRRDLFRSCNIENKS